MKKIVLSALLLLVLSASGSIAQTKFIAHRSHSGIDRLFNPDKEGNFGISTDHYRDILPEDTLKNADTSKTASWPIHFNFTIGPGEFVPASGTVTQRAMNDTPVFSLPENEVQESIAPQESVAPPLTPGLGTEVREPVDTVVKPAEPGLSGNGNSPSGTSSIDQIAASDVSNEGDTPNQSGSLPWLALGLSIPAAMFVMMGLRRRERNESDMG